VIAAHVALLLTLSRVGPGATLQEPRAISVGLGDWPGAGAASAADFVPPSPAEASETASPEALPPDSPRDLAVAEPPPAEPPVDPRDAPDVLAAVHALIGEASSQAQAATAVGRVATAGSGGDACGLAALLSRKLQADADLRANLARLPRDARSVANAVMLWDGGWVTARTRDAEVALAGVRASLRAATAGVDVGCLEQAQAGPNLLTIVEDDIATVLVVGSGDWSWSDVLATPEPGSIAPSITPANF
jgi:hypothetical protein